jgi:cytochrome c-type biogenesis protein CcmH
MRIRSARFLLLYAVWVLFQTTTLHGASTPDIDDRTREITAELRCVVCQNLSVADSPSEMAQQMRAIVREQVEAGRTTEQIKDFFVSKYGEWVLLKPKTSGFSALLWTLPYVVLIAGVIAALLFVRRVAAKKRRADAATAPTTLLPSESVLLRETNIAVPDVEDITPRAQLLRERERLRAELAELDFDFQAGKLSEPDYRTLTHEVEVRGAAVLQQLAAIPSTPATPKAEGKNRSKEVNPTQSLKGLQRWQLVSAAVFLLVFGIVLGVTLTNSIRSRGGENDSMTGDFMTGTNAGNTPAGAALVEGKRAFDRQEYPKAIEAFKKVLAEDPGHPEAHSYMGFILMQAGHGDGALLAFDKALARAPNFPMALWGKGMVLFQDKKDFTAARQIFEQLLNLMPPGEERNEVVKVLAEIPAADGSPKTPVKAQAATPSPAQSISGKITVDSKIKDRIDPQAPLFIIARAATGAAGPPLAVKKIDKPVFPLDYSLGQENVMMQGMPFSGKINISVRLDKDGNPATRGPGDLTGEYKKNPAEAGAKNVDIIIDQVTP